LATWTWGLLFGTTSRSDLDVESGDTDFLASDGDVLGGLHGGVRDCWEISLKSIKKHHFQTKKPFLAFH